MDRITVTLVIFGALLGVLGAIVAWLVAQAMGVRAFAREFTAGIDGAITKIRDAAPPVPGHVPVEAAERMSAIRVTDWPEKDPVKVWRMFRQYLNEHARACVGAVVAATRGEHADFPEVDGISTHAAREEACVAVHAAQRDADTLTRPLEATDRQRLVEAFERWNGGDWNETAFLSTIERILDVTAGRLGGKP